MRPILLVAACALGCNQRGSINFGDDTAGPANCAEALAAFDFEADEQGFGSDETDDGFDDPWEYGSPENRECHSGEGCWATGLDGEYGNCEAGALVSPVLDLSSCAEEAVKLSFWHLYRMEDQSSDTWWDGAKVQVSGDGGASWQEVNPSEEYTGTVTGNFSECEIYSEFDGEEGWSGIGGDWTEVTADLDGSVLTDSFQVRFWFASDRASVDEGWFVDDVAVVQ